MFDNKGNLSDVCVSVQLLSRHFCSDVFPQWLFPVMIMVPEDSEM